MHTNDFETFKQAVALAESGQKTRAYPHLKSLSYLYPDNVELLLALAISSPYEQEVRETVNRVESLVPEHPGLIITKAWMARQAATENPASVAIVRVEPATPAQPDPAESHKRVEVARALAAKFRPQSNLSPAPKDAPDTAQVGWRQIALLVGAVALPVLVFFLLVFSSGLGYKSYGSHLEFFEKAKSSEQARVEMEMPQAFVLSPGDSVTYRFGDNVLLFQTFSGRHFIREGKVIVVVRVLNRFQGGMTLELLDVK